ncbi:GNAT family N-acetyltransferase [Bacillus pseudomycoides]|uniref:GNAT family N-acetyltransferase n=1 Tax=Bacillus bingmayongensis TaxID=1150157 RepID=A0ABU5K300_9BACI|nr:GNAT family N-acetyltransferase [Bacillus pseudomycoides]
MKNRKGTVNDYKTILNVWEKSVEATHHFLKVEDKEEIKKEIPMYLPNLDIRMWYDKNVLVGFLVINQNHLEMLFLDPNEIGKGYGKQIIQLLINDFGIKTVDVNKDNENAKKLYLKNGFSIVSEKPIDNSGCPYPILHLKLK